MREPPTFSTNSSTTTRTWWYDENGHLTNYTDHDVYSFGEWSYPLTGDIVPYTQHNVENADFRVPGDFNTATDTFTGENIYRLPTGGKFVLQAVGRQVFNWDQSALFSIHGPNVFVDAFYERPPRLRPDLRRARRNLSQPAP